MTAGEITIRPLESLDDFRQCVALQRETWGEDFGECVPPSILQVCQKVGGVAAGAFDRDGRLLGFVFGLSGVREGRPAHWSDMLAVREEARGRGLGSRLKAYQRQVLLEHGIEVAYWTYDPLEAGNANININRLSAYPVEYVSNMYGEPTSTLHAGLTTDRLVVEWQLTDPRVEAILSGAPSEVAAVGAEAPIINTEMVEGSPIPCEPELHEAPEVRIEVPDDIQSIKRTSLETARSWRANVRRVFIHYMERGYRVSGFQRDREALRCFYVLARP
ncbi:MAG: GNAT family N-acetyltransferase [Gemmatimonadota bacterium]|nr:MAG: GNAT family N-acetyltransferase [Gemmatimonadota bacterium]